MKNIDDYTTHIVDLRWISFSIQIDWIANVACSFFTSEKRRSIGQRRTATADNVPATEWNHNYVAYFKRETTDS